LAYTLIRNIHLVQLRKHQIRHLELSSMEFLRKKLCNDTKSQGRIDSNVVIRNHTTTCTTLLLDADEHDDRQPSF